MKINHIEKFTHQGQEMIGYPVKLVLIDCKIEQSIGLIINEKHKLPIFISTKEEIKVGDIGIDVNTKEIFECKSKGIGSINYGKIIFNPFKDDDVAKVIAKSKDLSLSTLQDISTGKINEQGEYWLVCERMWNDTNATETFNYQIKLDLSNYVSVVEGEIGDSLNIILDNKKEIIPLRIEDIDKEEKKYKESEVINLLGSFAEMIKDNLISNKIEASKALDKWMEENEIYF